MRWNQMIFPPHILLNRPLTQLDNNDYPKCHIGIKVVQGTFSLVCVRRKCCCPSSSPSRFFVIFVFFAFLCFFCSFLVRVAALQVEGTVRRQNNSDKKAVLLRDGFQVIPLQSKLAGSASSQINIVLNWFEELKERVPVPWFSRSSPEKSSCGTLTF